MDKLIKAEWLKQKRTFQKKLIWIAPLVPLVISFILMGTMFFKEGAYNFWYTLFLPGAVTIISVFIIKKDKEKNHHNIFKLNIDGEKIWYSKIIVGIGYLIFLCLIFFIGVNLMSIGINDGISFKSSILASILFVILNLWQIPLWMGLALKIKSGFLIFASISLNIGVGILFAWTKLWIIPFSIVNRVMCQVLRILPNGVPLQGESNLLGEMNIFIGSIISIVLFFLLSFLTAKLFKKERI